MTLFVRGCLARLLLAVPLALAATATARDGELVDSGWSVAKPAVPASGPSSPSPLKRNSLDGVPKQTEDGLHAVPTPRADQVLRMAQRAGSANGWRAVGSASSATPSPVKTQESWVPSVGGGTQWRSFGFRASSSSANDDSTSVEPTTVDTHRPEPLPADELTPELLPGGIWLRRNRPIEMTVPPTAEDGEVHDDDVMEATPAVEPDAIKQDKPAPVSDSPKEAVPAPIAAAPPRPLTPQLVALRTRLRSVLRGYYQKSLNSQDHDPWEVMHGMLAYGIHSRVRQGGPRGEHITAVGWLCYNRPCKGKSLLYVSPEGELRAKQGVGLQGHMGQLLAMLAQCHVSPEYPIRVGNQEFTVQDLIEAEKKTCYPKSELTFKLIAMSHYLDLDATWVNDQGLDWNFSKLISEELAQPIRGAACGGTHRLSGLSLAVKARVKSGEPVDGEYAKAAEFVKNYQNYAFRMQNRDGSLSTKWFQGQGDEADIDRRVKTTGHILEWLVYSLSNEELRDPRTIRAVTYLTNLLYSNYDHEWEVGPKSHAVHALLLYDERVFQPHDPEGHSIIAPARGSRSSGHRGTSGRR